MKRFFLLLILVTISFLVKAQDIYEIKFVAGVTQYRCALAMWWDDGNGMLRVKYYSNNKTNNVEQTVRLEDTQYGLRIAGYNPVYAGTSISYPSYNADNFYLSQDEYGNLTCTNIDDDGNTSKCVVRKIEGYTAKQNFLGDFNWKL